MYGEKYVTDSITIYSEIERDMEMVRQSIHGSKIHMDDTISYDGIISLDDIKVILDRYDVRYDDSILMYVYNSIDDDSDGRVYIEDIYRYMECEECMYGDSGVHIDMSVCICKMIECDMKGIYKIYDHMNGMIDVRKIDTMSIYSMIDIHNRGYICSGDVYRYMKNVSVHMSMIECDRYIRYIHRYYSTISYDVFHISIVRIHHIDKYKHVQHTDRYVYNDDKYDVCIDRCISYIRVLIDSVRQMEDRRIDVCMRGDIDMKDIYSMIDIKKRGYIDHNDIYTFINSIQHDVIDKSSIKIMIQQYDDDNDGMLSYDEYSNMILPYDTSYRRDMMNRHSNTIRRWSDYNITSRKCIIDMIVCIIQQENRIYKSRHLTNRYDILYMYRLIDYNNKGKLDYMKIMNTILSYNVSCRYDDIILMIHRLDRNEDMRIELDEFINI